MRDRAVLMSMFDYDARPVTPGIVLMGTPASRGGYAIRDFLSAVSRWAGRSRRGGRSRRLPHKQEVARSNRVAATRKKDLTS